MGIWLDLLLVSSCASTDSSPPIILDAELIVSRRALDTLHAALLGVCYYHYSVTHFADYDALKQPHWSLLVQVGVGTVITLLVQCFYAYRIYRLSKRVIVPLVIVALSVGQEVMGGIVYMIRSFQAHRIVPKSSLQGDSVIFTTAGLACDVWIATSRSSLIYAPFFFVMIRLYSCSLMTIMNGRENLLRTLRMSVSKPRNSSLAGTGPHIYASAPRRHEDTDVESKLPDPLASRIETVRPYDGSQSSLRPLDDFQMTNWSGPSTITDERCQV
ncbi:unnamed protein product [Peniophora sp. CBMAI 1063]|nr:unnamed protein product [Peniophora sp. CBMAI 1063]